MQHAEILEWADDLQKVYRMPISEIKRRLRFYDEHQEQVPMAPERIMAMELKELRERVAVDVMGGVLSDTTSEHDGELRHWRMIRWPDGTSGVLCNFQPDAKWLYLGRTIEAMQERGFELYLSTYSDGASACFGKSAGPMSWASGYNLKVAVCRAALCAMYGV